jgi:hypothetical protein
VRETRNVQPGFDIKALVAKDEEKKPLPISSSQSPIFAEEQQRLFRGVLQLFNRQHIPYVVSGAFALQKHTGIWRNTKDLDLFLTAEDISAALRALLVAGFETQVCDPVWLAKAHKGEYYVDLITGMSNAVITVDRSWIERAAPSSILQVPVRVLAAEEFVASKLFVSRRERFDGADVVHTIYAAAGNFDWDRLLALAGEHWGVVLWALVLYQYVYPAHTSRVPKPVWEELLGRLRAEIEQPRPGAEFRGSLIDEFMFAIDVAEWGMEDLVDRYRLRRHNPIPSALGDTAA